LTLTLILRTWRICRAPNNVRKWQMGFNSGFKGLNLFNPIHTSLDPRFLPNTSGHLSQYIELCTTELSRHILIVMYVLFCIFCFHRASWHTSATLTEVFPCSFLSCKSNTRVLLALTGHRPPLFQTFLCCSMYYLCVNAYCTAATGWQPNCSLTNHIIYHKFNPLKPKTYHMYHQL